MTKDDQDKLLEMMLELTRMYVRYEKLLEKIETMLFREVENEQN